MPSLPLRDVARIARSLGHRDLAVIPSRRGFVATCSCGYRSANRRTDALAAQAAAHHLETVLTAWHAAGSPTSRTSPSDTPKLEDTSEPRSLRLA